MEKVKLPILRAVEARIEARSDAIRGAHPFWPCKAGCDHCCRSLPRLPLVTELEWQNISEAVRAHGEAYRAALTARILSAPQTGPLACPLLDGANGFCTIYEARPIACRTHGYYTERDAGLHCEMVSKSVDANGAADRVIWGNGEAIAHDLRPLGKERPLDAWLRDDDARTRGP